jgi:uncharacterized membrane protein HdeD (DUF308 family)
VGSRTPYPVTNPNFQGRPYQVTFLGWLFIVVGIVSTAIHLWKGTFDRWMPLIVLVGILAVVAGANLLRGANWARWLILVWLAFHVIVSALNSLGEALPHIVLLLVIGYVLLGPPTSSFFQEPQLR